MSAAVYNLAVSDTKHRELPPDLHEQPALVDQFGSETEPNISFDSHHVFMKL